MSKLITSSSIDAEIAEIKNKIETIRQKLHDSAKKGYRLTSEELITLSVELDNLLNKYNRITKE